MKIKEILKFLFYIIIDAHPLLYMPPINIYGYKFEIHKNDADPWPSFPHMHSEDRKFVLNIYKGQVYRKLIKGCIGIAKEKDMIKLWNNTKFLNIVVESRKNKPINAGELENIPYNWLNEENSNWIKENDVIELSS